MTVTSPERSAAPARRQAVFRRPEVTDGPAVWQLVENTPGLDSNSPYYYTLWFRDFADSSLVTTVDGEIVGFLTGYRRPTEPDTYFVWQTAVSPRHGIPFLGARLFEQAVAEQVGTGARFVEATVSADNKAIIMVLKKVARKYRAEVETEVLFPGGLLRTAADDPDVHHDEVLYRIGPLRPD